jgi:hypothetical protein
VRGHLRQPRARGFAAVLFAFGGQLAKRAGPSGYTTTVSSASALKSGACVSQPPPPPPGGTCKTGTPADLPNLTAVCSGRFITHTGTCNPDAGTCPSATGGFSFAFVFGSAWPGNNGATDEIFSLGLNQYLAIPVDPSPAGTESFVVNTTYMPTNNAFFAISDAPGNFTGSGVECSNGRNPNLVASSNGSAANCHLDPTKHYWLNMAPGVVVNGTFTACAKAPCKVAVQGKRGN